MGINHERALVNYIPISAPATRRPGVPHEKTVRASVGFVPQWFSQRLPIKFGVKWHEDCEYRYDALVKMKALLHQKFPSLPEFMPRDSGKGYDPDCATLSGVYGSKVIAMLYGFDVSFPDNDWPGDSNSLHLPLDVLMNLKEMDLDNNPVMQKLDAQMDHMERVFGRIDGFLNYQGILNTALKLRGNDIFFDMMDDEDFVDSLFSHIAGTTEALVKRVQKRQRESSVDIDLLSLSNCVVNMISPQMYTRFILPHDKRLSFEFKRFGIHTCNWDVTPYLSALREIPSLGYLDMGAMSDMSTARNMFPETRLAVFLSPLIVEQQPLDELEKELRRIVSQAAPCDIILADLTPDIEDRRLRDVLKIIDKVGS